jgi:beta-glucosidase
MYDRNEPLFPFGYGATFTSFDYSDLKLSRRSLETDGSVDITFSVRNTGSYDSDEVAQLYVSFPESKVERPVKELKGFTRTMVLKGETKRITITLKANDLMFWDATNRKWTLEPGLVKFFVGPSSADKRLEGEITIRGRR